MTREEWIQIGVENFWITPNFLYVGPLNGPQYLPGEDIPEEELPF